MQTIERSERLPIEGFESTAWGDGTIRPDYGRHAIPSLPKLAECALGLRSDPHPFDEICSDLETYDRVLFVVLDGFGYRKALAMFEEFPGLALRALGDRGSLVPITSVFPSTTVASLVSISTGLTPLEHGLIGYRLYLRETSAITNMIRYSMVGSDRSDAAFSAGLDLGTLFPGRTFQERLRDHGVTSHTILPQFIASSGLSRALYRGSDRIHPCAGLSDMLVTARQTLERADAKTFVSLYWPGLDTIAHVRGPNTDTYVAELLAVDSALQREIVGRVGRTLLILTADHGFVPMSDDDYIQLDDHVDMASTLLFPPVGEPRASYFFTRNGAKDAIARVLKETPDGGLICLEPSELLDSGILGTGTLHPEIENRLGDLAAVATGSAGIYHPYADAVKLRGMHGGLTADEMLVPLLVSEV